jgi:hypothetical protein
MARKIEVLLVDDLDGGTADETVTFSLDGAHYEIDLSSDNAKKLRSALQPFVEKGARQSGTAKRGRAAGRPVRGTSSRERSAPPTSKAQSRSCAVSNGPAASISGR